MYLLISFIIFLNRSLTIEPKLNGIEMKNTIRLGSRTYSEGRNQNNWWPTLHQICFTCSETTAQHSKKEKNSPKARWFLHSLYSSKNVHDSNVFLISYNFLLSCSSLVFITMSWFSEKMLIPLDAYMVFHAQLAKKIFDGF